MLATRGLMGAAADVPGLLAKGGTVDVARATALGGKLDAAVAGRTLIVCAVERTWVPDGGMEDSGFVRARVVAAFAGGAWARRNGSSSSTAAGQCIARTL